MKWFILLLLLSLPVFAKVSQKDCTNTDIRNTNPKIKNNKAMREHFTKPRNQDSIGWCYAFVAADMMSAETGTAMSSFHASIIYSRYRDQKLIDYIKEISNFNPTPHVLKNTSGNFKFVHESGHLDRAIKALQDRQRICTEALLPFDKHLGKTTADLINKLEAIKIRVLYKKVQEKLVCDELSNLLPQYGLGTVEFDSIAHSLMKDNIHETLDLLALQTCQFKQVPVPKRQIRYVAPQAQEFFTSLNQTLNQGRPVGMRYNVKEVATFSGNHVSLITARRWNNGRCEYKVRNTWGASCAYYQKGIDCNRDEGAFWLSDEKLKQTTTQLQYLSE